MRSKTVLASLWSLSDTFASYILKFFFAIAITRLLSPRDYGLVAYTALFIGVATWLSEWGFGSALIKKKDSTDIDFSTSYIFNILLSTFFFVLYYFIAPFIANEFNEPELNKILRITSIILILNALCYTHQIKLIKDRDFKGLTIINFVSSVISGLLGLILALYGFNYWALVFQNISSNFIRMFGLWFLVRWKPSFVFCWKSLKEQFHFGSRIFIQGLLENIFREIHALIIGKIYLTEIMGFYSRGQKFFDLFIIQTGIAINKVMYPTLVLKIELVHEHKRMYFRVYSLLFFVMAPVSLFLILLSKEIITVTLTEKWIDAAIYLKLYCYAGFIYLLAYFNSTTTLTLNRPNLYLGVDIIQKILIGLALIFTYKKGVNYIIWGWIAAYYCYYFVYEIVMYRLAYFSWEKYKNMAITFLSLFPSVLVYYLSSILIAKDLSMLIINIITQPIIFFAFHHLLKTDIYCEFRSLIIPFFRKNYEL